MLTRPLVYTDKCAAVGKADLNAAACGMQYIGSVRIEGAMRMVDRTPLLERGSRHLRRSVEHRLIPRKPVKNAAPEMPKTQEGNHAALSPDASCDARDGAA